MSIEIRNYLDGFADRTQALQAVLAFDESAFGEPGHDEDVTSPAFGVIEDDRTFLAWDGDDLVGTCANFSLSTSDSRRIASDRRGHVHRRPTDASPPRGDVAKCSTPCTQTLSRATSPSRRCGQPIAAIYGRFGYGVATERLSIEVPHAHSDAPGRPS